MVFNKLDVAEAIDAWPAFSAARAREGVPAIAVSAVAGQGIPDLRTVLAETLPDADGLSESQESAGIVIHRFESAGETFNVSRDDDDAYRVRGARIERMAAQTNFDNEESAERFQRDLARLGIDAQLRRAGVRAGDTVRIGGIELEWEPEAWEGR